MTKYLNYLISATQGAAWFGEMVHPARSFFWVLLETGGLSALSLTVLFVIARLLGPTELGTAALALGIVQMFAIVPETILLDALVQRRHLDDADLDTAFWICLGTGIALAAICWLVASLFGRIFESDKLPSLLSVAGLSLSFSGAGSVAIAVLRRNFLFKALALRSVCGRLCGAVAAILLAFFGFGVWSLIAQYLIQTAISVLFVWGACPWRPRFRFKPSCLRELLSFGIVSMGTRIVWISSSKLFTVLVGYFLGVAAVGYLNVAQRVVDTLHDMLAGVAYNLAMPIFSRQQDSREAMARTYHAATELVGLLVAPIFGGVAICAAPIIALVVGDGWSTSVYTVQVLAFAAMLEFPFLFAEAAITALGRPTYIFLISVLALGFFIISFLIYPPLNVVIASMLWGGRIIVTAPVIFGMLNRLINRSMADLVRESWAPLLGVTVMASAVSVLQTQFLAQTPPLGMLLIEIPVGALIYVAVIGLVKRDSLVRLIAFILSGFGDRFAAVKKLNPQT
jgi:polysaccharide transporter, PST family